MSINPDKLAYHIEWLDPQELVPYEHNAKMHDKRNVANIANSIKRYGWQQNLTITKDKTIIIGHGRQLAALQLGVKVPCKVIEDDLTDDDIRELRIADNLTHDGAYDWDEMYAEMDEFGLTFDGFDFDFGEDGAEEEYNDTGSDRTKPSAKMQERYQLIIDCEDERDMEKTYNKLMEAGIECRVSTL